MTAGAKGQRRAPSPERRPPALLELSSMGSWQEFSGLNRGYVLEAFDRYRQDPASVDPETRALFETWTPPVEDAPAAIDGVGAGLLHDPAAAGGGAGHAGGVVRMGAPAAAAAG